MKSSNLLTESDAAQYLNLSRRTLQGWRVKRSTDSPRFVRISSNCIRYRPEDLDVWVESRVRTSTSDPGPATPQTGG